MSGPLHIPSDDSLAGPLDEQNRVYSPGYGSPKNPAATTFSSLAPLANGITPTDNTVQSQGLNSGSVLQTAHSPHTNNHLETSNTSIQDANPCPSWLSFCPWWEFCSTADRSQPKARIFPSVAAIVMPITILFVLTSLEANWIQETAGDSGRRIRKATGYVVGCALATALAFLSAFTIEIRQIKYFRRFISLRSAMLVQVLFNLVLGALCIVVGALYQHNKIRGKHVWITPENPCIFVGGCLALLQAALLIADYLTTPNFNNRGHGYGGAPMQTAIGLANLVSIWSGFGGLIFSIVENRKYWHSYNSCYNAWVILITTGSTVLDIATINSKIFVFFWLPIGVLLMFVYFCCFGFGFVQRFDEKPLRRIREAEDNLRMAYRELRRGTQSSKELGASVESRIEALQKRLVHLHNKRLRYFVFLFISGVILKICSWLLGSIAFTLTESKWSYWDSMVFLFFNLMTVGIQDMVPKSAVGMPIYHAYTYIDILCTAALDALLFHIVWNLVPWSWYLQYSKSVAATATGKVFRRPRHDNAASESGNDSEHEASEIPQALASAHRSALPLRNLAVDQLEDAINVASHLRSLLIRNAISEAELHEFDRLLATVENRIDAIHLNDAKEEL
ncbi:hypothetical protein GGI26_000915 [Coemansia sp. RSA 1358]|nr:hypothetical protein EDC05_000794 [Coemansia umbellata]KAJ2625112.1 hypothetical protein GGI26_000915 [Coemansia sp. RSA 1358]